MEVKPQYLEVFCEFPYVPLWGITNEILPKLPSLSSEYLELRAEQSALQYQSLEIDRLAYQDILSIFVLQGL